jgi:predicted ATP-binding protein involved in virulence
VQNSETRILKYSPKGEGVNPIPHNDIKIADILDELRELQQMTNQYSSQISSVNESVENLSGGQKRSLPTEEISLEQLRDKIRELEKVPVNNSQDLQELETRSREDRLNRLTNLFRENEIGKNIVSINNMYYYKVIRPTLKKNRMKQSRTEGKSAQESQFHYYPVDKVPPQNELG